MAVKVFYLGGIPYQDCMHCGLAFNQASVHRAKHEDGTCVAILGPAETKSNQHINKQPGRQSERQTLLDGQNSKAATWPPRRGTVARLQRDIDAASSGVVETPTPPRRTGQVEKSWS